MDYRTRQMGKSKSAERTGQDNIIVEVVGDDVVGASSSGAPTRLEPQVINDVLIPATYEVWADGVYRRKVFTVPPDEGPPPVPNLHQACPTPHKVARLEQIASRPFYVSGLGHRLDDTRELVALTYLASFVDEDKTLDDEARAMRSLNEVSGDAWATMWVRHGQIANTQEVIRLADDVFPVNSVNARDVVSFLTRSVDENFKRLTRHRIVRRCGHHEIDGRHGWLVGKHWIGPGNVSPDLTEKDKLVLALHPAGSEQRWLDFTGGLMSHHWIVRWTMACSFTAPLLRFITRRTFFAHHYTNTGGGKSALAYLGQSAWGHPKQFAKSLNTSQISTTEVFNYISDLPVLFDELQASTVSPSLMIMQVTEEEPRGRVKAEGGLVHSSQEWRTLVRTTGEMTLAGADKTDPGGQAGRVLEVRHPGIPYDDGVAIYRFIEGEGCYGHAGLRFLSRLSVLVNDKDGRAALLERYVHFREAIVTEMKQQRTQYDNLAAIALGEYLMLLWVYGLPKNDAWVTALRDAIDMATNYLRSQDDAEPLWQRAIDYLVEHRHTMPQCYADISTTQGQEKIRSLGSRTAQPVVGAYNAGADGKEVWYFPEAMSKVLRTTFSIAPTRLWEELVEHNIVRRGKDRLGMHRQLEGVFSGRVYVALAEKLFEPRERAQMIDVSALANYVPCETFEDDLS